MAVDIANLPEIGQRSATEILELLAKRFQPSAIQSRSIAGRSVPYVPVGEVISRLNRAAGSWDWRIVSTTIEVMPLVRRGGLEDVPVAVVVGELSIAGLGARQGIGVAPLEGGEDAPKSAASDALKKASSLYGVSLDGH